MVRYASSTGVLWAYVRVPSLDYQNDTTLYLYYGNASASDQSDPEGVWNDNFAAMYHLDEEAASSSPVYDATKNNCDGIMADADADTDESYPGKVGLSVNFTGIDDYDWIMFSSGRTA